MISFKETTPKKKKITSTDKPENKQMNKNLTITHFFAWVLRLRKNAEAWGLQKSNSYSTHTYPEQAVSQLQQTQNILSQDSIRYQRVKRKRLQEASTAKSIRSVTQSSRYNYRLPHSKQQKTEIQKLRKNNQIIFFLKCAHF